MEETQIPQGTSAETVLQQLAGHASCRRYTDEDVDDHAIHTMVDMAQRAATSSNLQLWSAVVVRDATRRERLAALCGDQEHIRRAPVFIAWCADRARLDRAAELRGYRQNTDTVESFLVAAVDTAVAMQNATIAAEAMGFGTCYIGALRNDTAAVIELLGLPRHVFPIAGMTVGHPARRSQSVRPRLPREAVLHTERYTPVSDEILEAYDTVMRDTGIYRGRQQPGRRADGTPAEQIVVERYGWLEHSARRTSQPRRVDMRANVERQGFMLR